jgi:hypothetical protein
VSKEVTRSTTATVLLAICLIGALASVPPAASQKLDGRRVMEVADEYQRIESRYAEGLVTVEEKGRVREKAWREWTTGWGAEARSLVQFLEPAEVRGVGLLTIGHAQQADEQWFYTPAIDRHRRIARVEKSTRFLGTHFTYEDMQPRDIDDYQYRLLDEAELDGRICYRIEARPRPESESQYSRLVFWVSKDPLVTLRSEGFVERKLRRTFHGSEVRLVDGIATVHRWQVEDTKRQGRTTLLLRNVRRGLAVEDSLFGREAMRVIHPAPN